MIITCPTTNRFINAIKSQNDTKRKKYSIDNNILSPPPENVNVTILTDGGIGHTTTQTENTLKSKCETSITFKVVLIINKNFDNVFK